MENDELRLESLEASVVQLNDTVQSLTYTLKVVGALTERQQLQDEAQAATDARVDEVKALAAHRYQRTSRIQLIVGVLLVLAITAGPFIAYVVLTDNVNHEFKTQQAQLASSCALRNQANVEVPRKRELALAEQYRLDKSSSPTIAKIHQDSADALAKVVVDCSIYLQHSK